MMYPIPLSSFIVRADALAENPKNKSSSNIVTSYDGNVFIYGA
jgi:hypothetical protein